MGTDENIADMFDGSENIKDAFNSQSDRLLGKQVHIHFWVSVFGMLRMTVMADDQQFVAEKANGCCAIGLRSAVFRMH